MWVLKNTAFSPSPLGVGSLGTSALVGVTSSWFGAGPRVTDAVVLSTFETTSPALPLQWVAAVHWVVGSDQMCGSVRMRCGRGTSKNGEKSRKFTKISDKPRKKKIIIKILEKTRKISNKTLKKVARGAGYVAGAAVRGAKAVGREF